MQPVFTDNKNFWGGIKIASILKVAFAAWSANHGIQGEHSSLSSTG